MFYAPFEFKCSACGREPNAAGWGLCALCGRLFCGDHLFVKKSIATCESCAAERERREASSGISVADHDLVIALLQADVEGTIGPGYHAVIVAAAEHRRVYAGEPGGYAAEVVDEVQQYFHYTFVDTTWPACPHHPNHPLWFSDGWWRCERVEAPIARLGTLSGVGRGREGLT